MVYIRIASFLPKGTINAFKKELDYLNINISEKRFVGFLFIYGICLSLGIAINLKLFFNIEPLLTFAFFFILFFGGTYLWMSLVSESKGRYVEKILPDALQLIASNIKAGLTTESALVVSSRPEFGPLGIELKNASAKIMAGMPLEKALVEISEKIKSGVLERTLWLISKGIASGGQMADLLMQIADDLREQISIKEEVNANISMYVLLIFVTSALGAPLLFGISSFIVEVMSTQMGNIHMPTANLMANLPQNMGMLKNVMSFGQGKLIAPSFILFFSSICLAMVSIFSSLTIGIINSGKEKDGIRFIPVILVISFTLFFLARAVLHTFFGGMLV